jgi:hypothetical protein
MIEKEKKTIGTKIDRHIERGRRRRGSWRETGRERLREAGR